MKVQVKSPHALITAAIVTAGIIITCFGLVAWAGVPDDGNKFRGDKDTIPAKEKKVESVKDFDKELHQLDEAGKQLEELRKKDWEKVRRDVEELLNEINLEKISVDLEQTISKIDMEKLGKEIEASLSKIDFDKIEEDIEAALDDIQKVDKEKIKHEIQRARADVERELKNKEWQLEIDKTKKHSMKEIEEALQKARQEIVKAKEDLKFEKIDLKETMVKAQAEVNKAKEEIRAYQEMVYGMERDGLLNTDESYLIEYRTGEISIDGKKQSSAVTAKYRKYFKKEKVTIKKQDGDLDIDVD